MFYQMHIKRLCLKPRNVVDLLTSRLFLMELKMDGEAL